jgi:levansucrase
MMQTFRWTSDHVAAIGGSPFPTAPIFTPHDVAQLACGLDVWDHWPALTPHGALAEVANGLLVIALSAPIAPNPDERHGLARLRLFHRVADHWRDLGPLLPDDFSPGSREWAGSALFDSKQHRLTLFFTAAGRRGETETSFEQRLFTCDVRLQPDLRPNEWTTPIELFRPDGQTYETDLTGGGALGTIKAFRDPWYLRDPERANEFMLFTASRPNARDDYNGLIGAAFRRGSTWQVDAPWVDATGINNELERPHTVANGGRVYLFWSTQRKVFAPSLRFAPTGLYGLVSDSLGAPWRPINGHGLVFANPEGAPCQAYSWQVLPDLSVWGFADLVGLDRAPHTPEEARRHFGGAPAPTLRLALDDDQAWLLK